MAQPAALGLDEGDPRRTSFDANLHLTHDKSVTFEQYVYHAKISRAEEATQNHAGNAITQEGFVGNLKRRFRKEPAVSETSSQENTVAQTEKELSEKRAEPTGHHENLHISDTEWYRASRALRTATWAGVFYLITTDILGPFSVPWAFSQMGYGPGIALYTVFAAFSG
jgi:hypothetical protein